MIGGARYGFTWAVDKSNIIKPKIRLSAKRPVIRLVKILPPSPIMAAILHRNKTHKRQLQTTPTHEGFLLKCRKNKHQHYIRMQGVRRNPLLVLLVLLRSKRATADAVFFD